MTGCVINIIFFVYSYISIAGSQVVDGYVFLIMDTVNKKNSNTVYSVSTFFYQKLSEYGYDGVSNWIKVLCSYIH